MNLSYTHVVDYWNNQPRTLIINSDVAESLSYQGILILKKSGGS